MIENNVDVERERERERERKRVRKKERERKKPEADLLASSSHHEFHMVWKQTSVPSLSNITTLTSTSQSSRPGSRPSLI